MASPALALPPGTHRALHISRRCLRSSALLLQPSTCLSLRSICSPGQLSAVPPRVCSCHPARSPTHGSAHCTATCYKSTCLLEITVSRGAGVGALCAAEISCSASALQLSISASSACGQLPSQLLLVDDLKGKGSELVAVAAGQQAGGGCDRGAERKRSAALLLGGCRAGEPCAKGLQGRAHIWTEQSQHPALATQQHQPLLAPFVRFHPSPQHPPARPHTPSLPPSLPPSLHPLPSPGPSPVVELVLEFHPVQAQGVQEGGQRLHHH